MIKTICAVVASLLMTAGCQDLKNIMQSNRAQSQSSETLAERVVQDQEGSETEMQAASLLRGNASFYDILGAKFEDVGDPSAYHKRRVLDERIFENALSQLSTQEAKNKLILYVVEQGLTHNQIYIATAIDTEEQLHSTASATQLAERFGQKGIARKLYRKRAKVCEEGHDKSVSYRRENYCELLDCASLAELGEDNDEMQRLYERGIEHSKQIGSAYALQNAGGAAEKLHRKEQARALYTQAMQKAESIGDFDMASEIALKNLKERDLAHLYEMMDALLRMKTIE